MGTRTKDTLSSLIPCKETAMPYHFFRSILVIASLLVFTNNGLCQIAAKAANQTAEPTIVGPWHAESVTLLSTGGEKKTLPISKKQPFSVTIPEKNMIMRVGDQKFADMSFVLDNKQTPTAIDVKFQDQEMPGIYELKGDSMKICLNDSKKGRPKDIDSADNDMTLILHRYSGRPLMKINADGTNPIALTSEPELTFGTSDWSPDGSKIAVDCWCSFLGYDYDKCHVDVINSDGSSPKDMGDGTLPSWSPDGKKISYSRYTSRGVWVMNSDGSDNVLIDSAGWSSDWSPKNKDELAYTTSSGNGRNICVLDLKTKDRRYLLDKAYRNIYWGFVWSPDGQWICYEGTLPDGSEEIAMVNTQGQSKGFKILLPNESVKGMESFRTCFSWSPDSKQIALALKMNSDKYSQIYILDIDGNKPPKRLAGQNPNKGSYTPAWSPDGKVITYGLLN